MISRVLGRMRTQHHDLRAAILGAVDQRKHAHLRHLVERDMNHLPRDAELARDIGRTVHAEREVGHQHGLRPRNLGPTTRPDIALQPFIKPDERLQHVQDRVAASWRVSHDGGATLQRKSYYRRDQLTLTK